jgi:hypothetical protein
LRQFHVHLLLLDGQLLPLPLCGVNGAAEANF